MSHEFEPKIEVQMQEKVLGPEEILQVMAQKYGEGVKEVGVMMKIINFISELQQAYGSLHNLKGKRILDLGCGSIIPGHANVLIKEITQQKNQGMSEYNSPFYGELQRILPFDMLMNINFNTGEYNRTFEPWFDRVLVELGADPVGVDTGNLDGENFEHHNIDLTENGALDLFPDKSFDAIHSSLFFNSPQLQNNIGREEITSLRSELLNQAKRLVKDNGKIMGGYGGVLE